MPANANTTALSHPDLVLTFSALTRSHPVRSLAQLAGQQDDACLRALQALQKARCVHFDAAHGHWYSAQGTALRRAADAMGPSSRRADPLSPYAQALLQLRSGQTLTGCDALLGVARHHLSLGHSGAAMICLDILLKYTQEWDSAAQSDTDIRHYVALVRSMLGLSMFLCKRVDDALMLLPKARQVAHVLGDRRVTLLLDLTEASLRHLTQMHNTEPPRALLARTVKDIQDLGDADILASTAHSIGILHFMQAEFQEAIEFLRVGNSKNCLNYFDYFESSRNRYIASAACALGKDALAFGAMASGLRTAELEKQRLTAKWCQVHLVDDLLRMGKTHEALPLLDGLIDHCDPETETRLWNWGQRNLAHYHFQCGKLETAHRILHRSMQLSLHHGLHRPYYNFTWLFDMLWRFDEHGLPPIPGYELELELTAALQGPNRQFKAAALRIRALQQERRGAAPAAIAELARHALEHAEAVENPLEIARSRLILARCSKDLGLHSEGDALHQAACATLARYTQYDCPLDARRKAAPYVPPVAHCLARLQQGLEALPLWEVMEEHMRRIVLVVADALEVERTALFQREQQGRQGTPGEGQLVCLGSHNLAPAEIHSAAFAPYAAWFRENMQGRQPAVLHTAQGAALCVPLSVPREAPLLLVAHCRFLPERIAQQSLSLFQDVGQAVALELRATFLLQKRMEENRRQSEARARMTAARVSNAETPYYGVSLSHMLQQADHVAATDASVLVLGETGVGKEMLARRIHAYGGRVGPFVPVHPASTPENLFESEFFGHEKGAFTGAHRQKIGLFELADKGTLFIDELGDVPMTMQTKLLRVLQEKTFLRVGGTREISSDFRLVCATNRDLPRMLREGTFREDLYYRVAVMPLYLPPLRERPEDVLLLARMFLERFARRYQRELPELRREDTERLCAYNWPGNIRELKSVMERTAILYNGGRMHLALDAVQDIPPAVVGAPLTASPSPALSPSLPSPPAPPARNPLLPSAVPEAPPQDIVGDLPGMETLQARYILHVLKATQGKIDGPGGAARILQMKRSTLYAKIRKYGLDAHSLAYGGQG